MTLEGQERDGEGAAGEMGQERVSEVGIATSGFERQMSDGSREDGETGERRGLPPKKQDGQKRGC